MPLAFSAGAALTVVLDGVVVLEGLLLGLGLACFTFSLVVVLPEVSEIAVALELLLLEAVFWLTESVFEDLDTVTNFTGSADVGVGATSCAGVSTFCFREADVSLDISSLSELFVDVEDAFGMVVNGGISTVSFTGIDGPDETGGELSF